jgi:hypothetical protein
VPPANRTLDDKAPAKSGNSSASADKPSDSIAETDLSEELPLDGDEDYEALPETQPEADQVLNAPKAATTQPSSTATAAAKPTTQPAVADKKDAPETSETVSDAQAKSDKKPAGEGAPKVTVTELPVEEVKPDAPKADYNK